ncbi:TetR family transcriptional regulator [Rhizobium sp. Root1203]|uniref:TetR/AcrR family transcriptional regulator n=1 Tax=Rhizobium sp. Root1203 TaxID=1736427 RepID=UPI00070E15E2|nr:TetR/AcrR family transcriptional regulator [Rhizobium sp. Root1203]KQV27541.1 TetR family transcriptional regulator [Rhizobium sp. Root1203]
MRKEPQQARARATVETMIEAGARILSEEGWAGFTTNRVAEVGGISIGSLYQYFPDKLSLIEAVRRRHLDDCLAVMRKSGTDGLSPAQFVANLVRDMVAAHSTHPGLHRVLLDEAPSFDCHRNPNNAFEVEYLGYYAEAVATYRNRKPNAGDRAAALIISDALDGAIHNAARRGTLKDPLMQSELVRLISLYLADGGETAQA